MAGFALTLGEVRLIHDMRSIESPELRGFVAAMVARIAGNAAHREHRPDPGRPCDGPAAVITFPAPTTASASVTPARA